ncbi:hypothetical protein [Deinococcus hohokamensis]|uniref:Uncharacterized protein n=1 Tax=Deinococcus hohokamensis TaxID=309883 RepID=A0ABV9I7K0_9DEIO
MNKALMPVRTAEKAKEAVQAGNFKEARQWLTIIKDRLEEGKGGNAAHAARRKVMRIEAEARDALTAAGEPTDVVAPDAPAAGNPIQPEAAPASLPVTQVPAEPLPAVEVDAPAVEALAAPDSPVAAEEPTEAPVVPVATALAPVATGEAKRKGVAPPHSLSAEGWALVAAGLASLGMVAADREADALRFTKERQQALLERNTYAAKVAERQIPQVQIEATALTGHIEAANAAWDRLFDVVTALRGAVGKARRAGEPCEEKVANDHAAREDSLRIRHWARGTQAA